MKLFRLVLEFYLTLAIPLLYALILYFIAVYPDTLKFSLINQNLPLIVFLLFTSILGLILWIWSYISLNHAFGVLPSIKPKVTTGIYKYLNHPMYLGIFLFFTSLALIRSSLPGLVLNLTLLTPINLIRAYH